MPGTSNVARVIVFARAPRPGFAKTRLIPLLGAGGAAALHARLIEHTLATAKSAGVGPVELHGTPANDKFLRACAARHRARLVDQCEGDLGQRMHGAFACALAQAPRILLIGSDCPALGAGHLRSAAQALEEGHEAVFAPTEDGGYALIGLTETPARLFADIPWSTPAVMEQTRARLRELGMSWAELDTLWDVDRPEDYLRLRGSGLIGAALAFARAWPPHEQKETDGFPP